MQFSFKKNEVGSIELSLALLLASLPLPFVVINIFSGLFCLFVLININRNQLKFNLSLLIPILYYLICVTSLIWTVDSSATAKYLSKGLFFLLIPLLFFCVPKLDHKQRNNILALYSYIMVAEAIFYLGRALFRYLTTNDISHFFYHELVTLDVNAIYISMFISLAFITLLNKSFKRYFDYIFLLILFVFLILLSSKNIIVITFIGIIITLFKNYKSINKKTLLLICLGICLISIPISSKIYERFKLEFVDSKENTVLKDGIVSVSLKNAWEQESFSPNHYFNGTSFRLYQIRVFKEIMSENDKFLTGFGPSTVQEYIIKKHNSNNLYDDYNTFNFHNQYLQTFSTIGIFGFIILILMHINNWILSIKSKDILFIFFTILTTSIMFSESLFERQRGIVFFVLLYCIFNKTIKNTLQTKN